MEYSLIRNECSKDLSVMAMAPVMVAPCLPSPKIILSLSNLDDQPMLRMAFNTLLVYNTCNSSANPVKFPPAADIEDIPPLVIQVTRFSCGGVIVAASFYHCLCDGRGSVQFLKGLAEIARGEVEDTTNEKYLLCSPEGYYGNGFVGTCALSTAQDLVNGSIIHTVKAIRKSKLAILNDRYLRSSIDLLEMNRYKEIDMRAPDRETLIVSDWTRLGFDEVDFGWGEAANACPLRWNGLAHANTFLFLRPPKSKDGVKMLVCLPKVAIKAFGMEIQTSSLSNRLFVGKGGRVFPE
eukprot:Gb_26893 [translate_table: standard]